MRLDGGAQPRSLGLVCDPGGDGGARAVLTAAQAAAVLEGLRRGATGGGTGDPSARRRLTAFDPGAPMIRSVFRLAHSHSSTIIAKRSSGPMRPALLVIIRSLRWGPLSRPC